MSEQNTATEKKDETIATQPQTEVTVMASEVDAEAELQAKDEELAQVRKEKENYRKAYLKAGGKLPEDSEEKETPEQETVMRRIVREELLNTKEAQLQADKDALIAKTLKRNKELEVALKSRGQITSPSAAGANLDKPEVKTDSYFSKEQIQALKAKGWSDKKIEEAKKNMRNPGVPVPPVTN